MKSLYHARQSKKAIFNLLLFSCLLFLVTLGMAQNPPTENGPLEVVRIIDPDNGPGTDYTSLQDFADTEKRNLVSANEIAVALCRSSNGTPDGPAQFYDWVTDTACYVKIIADTDHRASARWDDNKYRIIEHTTLNSECIDIEIDNIVIDGIQMRLTGSGGNNDVLDPDAGDKFIIRNCYVWLDLSSGSGSGIDPKSAVEIYNCIFRESQGIGVAVRAKPGAEVCAYNNTFVGWERAFETEGVVTAVNNISRGSSADAYYATDGGIFTAVSDYNSSQHSGDAIVRASRSNTQSPWFSGATSDPAIFVDAANGNYHLKPGAIFVAVGCGPAADPDVPARDIDNDARFGATADLGADAIGSGVVGVEEPGDSPETVEVFELGNNYPNPFNPETHIGFRISDFGYVRLAVYDLRGRKVATLLAGEMPPGAHEVQWDGRNDRGEAVSTGVYMYQMTAQSRSGQSFREVRKMLLVR